MSIKFQVLVRSAVEGSFIPHSTLFRSFDDAVACAERDRTAGYQVVIASTQSRRWLFDATALAWLPVDEAEAA